MVSGKSRCLLLVMLLLVPRPAFTHPAPFSYLDLRIGESAIDAKLVMHIIDAAHDLGVTPVERLLDRNVAESYRDRITAFIAPRLVLANGAAPLEIEWGAIDPLLDRQALRIAFRIHTTRPATLQM